MAAAALRPAILRRIRLSPTPSLALAAAGTGASHPHALARWLAPRPMSSHDAHLTREEVVDRVLDVLKSHPKVDPSKVTPEAHFEKDLGLDSLDTVEVVMAIEEEFKLEIPDMEADKIDSLPLAIEYVANHPMAG
ncbi:acyl carrier protein 1, mitochondrial-like [Miscanthus floridulus]|uniref:acyl carrier protein 1, mitochondrial-like n=1 Tax=Miscanthus floridulus TaxID=154761 RepID=UPI00345A66B2